ncbi:DDE-type integrase/transposase/recombinase [Streptomyces sp. NPDC030920]|uniref:DDE-type integrase/transposase/recombinase n=1 Tax=Streptomyces sp. NPDC030920 TaxID=3365308 RepID=UPI00384F729F
MRRDFTADAPDQVWCGDMTEITTGEGKLYLATVIDLFSRRLLGYAMGERQLRCWTRSHRSSPVSSLRSVRLPPEHQQRSAPTGTDPSTSPRPPVPLLRSPVRPGRSARRAWPKTPGNCCAGISRLAVLGATQPGELPLGVDDLGRDQDSTPRPGRPLGSENLTASQFAAAVPVDAGVGMVN